MTISVSRSNAKIEKRGGSSIFLLGFNKGERYKHAESSSQIRVLLQNMAIHSKLDQHRRSRKMVWDEKLR
jgi:hypothetical protein